MYHLADICCLCLKNNIKLQSVLINDNDGINFNEKLRCCFPEIVDSTPDSHKLACSECLDKLRYWYDSKQSVIRNNTVIRNYLDSLHCESKTRKQPSIILAARKRRRNVCSTRNLPEVKVENVGNNFKLKIKNVNLISTNEEQQNAIDNFSQPMANENIPFSTKYNILTEGRNLETKNVENVLPVAERETICIKQEPQLEDGFTTNYLNKEANNYQGNSFRNNDTNIEMTDEETSRSKDPNNQKEITTLSNFKSNDASEDCVKFCITCQESLFKDLSNINLHLYVHMQLSNCLKCEVSLEEINKFQRHMFIHCRPVVDVVDNGKCGDKLSCLVCDKQFDDLDNLKKHISVKHITNFVCLVCSLSFNSRASLFRHILVLHCHVELFQCKICSKRLTCKTTIQSHMINDHYSGNICFCIHCKKMIRNPKALKRHISKIHGDSRQVEDNMLTNGSLEKVDAVTNVEKEVRAVTELENKVGAVTEIENKVGTVIELEKKVGAITELESKVGAVTEVENKVGTVIELENKVGAITELKNKVGAVTELENKVDAVKELEEKFGPVTEPEKIYIKQELHFSDEDFSSDEESEDEIYVIEKNSTIGMAEESNSRAFNSVDLEKFINTSVKPNTPVITEASYCELDVSFDQSDPCEICQKMFTYLSILSEHLNAHMQEFSCSLCKDSAENISRLQRHMLVPCRNSNTPEDISNMTNIRINNEEIVCAVCQNKFYYYILRKHMYSHIKNLTCVLCNKLFRDKMCVHRHLMGHCNLKPFHCKACDAKFTTKASLKYHVENTHTKQVLVCQYCEKVLKSKKSLRNHILNLHPHNTYRCEVCKKIFLYNNELETHASEHTSRGETVVNFVCLANLKQV